MSRESHAWVLAALDRDPQVQKAIASAKRSQAQLGGSGRLELLAYSDGSVIGGGVEGSAAAILVIARQDVTSIVWLAPADGALSSGRAEWVGLVLVLYNVMDSIVRRVRAGIVLRLDNIQVVNIYNDDHFETSGTAAALAVPSLGATTASVLTACVMR